MTDNLNTTHKNNLAAFNTDVTLPHSRAHGAQGGVRGTLGYHNRFSTSTPSKGVSKLSFLAPILLLIGGLLFIAAASLLGPFAPQWLSLFIMFGFANIAFAKYLKLSHRLKSVWSARKAVHFPVGMLIGVIPAMAVITLTGDATILAWSGITISAASVAVTLMIVTWEELWFRGIILDYAASKYSPIGSAIVFAAIFCALHVFNPNLDLLAAAPDLLLGGYALAMSYFVFNSIWAPIGMHFGNNLLEGALLQLDYRPLQAQPFLYISSIALVSSALTFVSFMRTRLNPDVT